MVSASGLLFTIEDHATTEGVNAPVEYHLVARDAFNEITLWKMPMKQWSEWQTNSIKSIQTQQQRLLAALENRVYAVVEFGGPVIASIAWLMDTTDGHQLQEIRFHALPVWDGISIAHQS